MIRQRPLLCVPIAANDPADMKHNMDYLKDISPDLVEFRADYYNRPDYIKAVDIISDSLPDIPVIFTFRKHDEGGSMSIKESKRVKIILKAVASGCISLVDIEESTREDYLKIVVEEARQRSVQVLMSYHNFEGIPNRDVLKDKVCNMSQNGADIAKIAVMPRCRCEAFRFVDDYKLIKRESGIPVIGIAMGKYGRRLRLFTSILESPIVYAAGLKPTAPGQIDAHLMRRFN